MDNFHGDFYITTPIYYINDKPHIGSAYTTIVADVLARAREQRGEIVTFLTGTDEFSQKTLDAAIKNEEDVNVYTDRMADIWMNAWAKLGISNTDFIRTTEERHIETVKDIWGRMAAAGDIYKGQYQGLYCKGHEAFMKEDELTSDGLCPDHNVAPELVTEENYFFRLSNYQEQLLALYDAHPEFVAPAHRFNDIRAFVENGLEDISFSREQKQWGIPVPSDPSQVIYVWADALVNYISAIGIERWEEHPADVHAVGKDILRFHAVIWPAMLLSAGLPLPGQIIANGFITVNGTKMGKSLGNAVDPLDLRERYGNDALRYFLMREIPYGGDGDFTEDKFRERYNADLANGLGNFAARVLTLAEKDELLGNGKISSEFNEIIREMKKVVQEKITDYKFNEALAAVWETISFGDKFVNEHKVWEIKDDKKRKQALLDLISLLEAITFEIAPFLPETARKLSAAVVREESELKIAKPEILFPRIK